LIQRLSFYFFMIRIELNTLRSPSSTGKISKLLGRMPCPGFEPRYLHLYVWVYNGFVISSIYQKKKRIELNTTFFFGSCRGLNPKPCISYALSQTTELSSRGLKKNSNTKHFNKNSIFNANHIILFKFYFSYFWDFLVKLWILCKYIVEEPTSEL